MIIDASNIPSTPYLELHGVRIAEVDPKRVVLTLDVEEKHQQPYGIVHGGVYCTLAESAASIGAVIAQDGRPAVGQSNHTDFLRATRSGTLTAVATPVHVGRSVQLWNVEITDDRDRVVAQSKVRMFNLDPGGSIA